MIMQGKNMYLVTKLGGIAAIALLAGCSTLSSLNPFSGKTAPRNPPAALVDFKPTLAVRSSWTVTVGDAGAYAFSPAAAAGSVFAAAADGSIVRIDVASGRQLWRIKTEVPLTAGVGTDGKTIAVGGADGALLAFDGEGKLLWKAQASSEILSAPAVGQGLVIVRSLDNRIAAFDVASGTRRWMLQRTAPPLTLRAAPGIVIADSTAYVALPGGRLLALALSNGAPRWEVAVGDPRGATELERVADVSGFPLLSGSSVCAAAYQGRVGCVDAASGAGGWSKPLSSDVGVGGDQRFIFAADERGILNAFTRDGGISVWRNDKLANRGLSAPTSFGRAVVVGDSQGYIHFLAREDGAFIARAGTDGSAIVAAPLVVGDNLILQTKAGAVVALATE